MKLGGKFVYDKVLLKKGKDACPPPEPGVSWSFVGVFIRLTRLVSRQNDERDVESTGKLLHKISLSPLWTKRGSNGFRESKQLERMHLQQHRIT